MADSDVVMTPSQKGKVTHIKIERKKKQQVKESDVVHVAGGKHQGLVINRPDAEDMDLGKPQLQLGFKCYLVDQKTEEHYVESRQLKFWYEDGCDYYTQVTTAYEFFKELLEPENFPRDYVGFIKKCMKQMQKECYYLAKKMDLEVQRVDSTDAAMSPGFKKVDTRPVEDIVREKLLTVLESAYPNVLSAEDLVRITASDQAVVTAQIEELQNRNLIQPMEQGGFIRRVLDDKTKVEMVKQMPTLASNLQPTIAIITARYCEKMAVDAMMENKTTYVRYKTEGESNVYTTGYIGDHKVVTTKLPAIGHFRAAQISSGNTTTRLLGTFQNIEHVFLVGISGSVPHFTDYYKHGRLGDVMISTCDDQHNLYYYCDKITQDKGEMHYQIKAWAPRELDLQQLVAKIRVAVEANPDYSPWQKYIQEGQELLQAQEQDYQRPPISSDRLYMVISEGQVIEMQHPMCPDGLQTPDPEFPDGLQMPDPESPDGLHIPKKPTIRFGVFGAGRPVKSQHSRHGFASKYGVSSFDMEFDQVLDSIVGNRKDSFMFIRGFSDYVDGSKNKEWEPYASLTAAAMVKYIIMNLRNVQLDEF